MFVAVDFIIICFRVKTPDMPLYRGLPTSPEIKVARVGKHIARLRQSIISPAGPPSADPIRLPRKRRPLAIFSARLLLHPGVYYIPH